jgi:hypothetical protein
VNPVDGGNLTPAEVLAATTPSPQETVAGATAAWDSVRWFFNVTAAQQYNGYDAAVAAYGGIG